MSRSALELARCLKSQCWEHTHVVLGQLDGVGPKIAKALGEARIKDFATIMKQRPETLDSIAKKSPTNGWGKRLLVDVRRLPLVSVQLFSKEESIEARGVRVCCDIVLKLLNDKNLQTCTKRGTRKLTLSVLLCTSDNQFIEWKRLKASKLDENGRVGVTLTRRILLVKPSQKIECHVTCEDMAGLNWTATLKPNTPSSKYPIPLGVFDEDTDDDTFAVGRKGRNTSEDDDVVRTKARKVDKTTSKRLGEPLAAGEELPNGNYKCRHTCQGQCRHSCCDEGLPRKPKAGKTRFLEASSSEDEQEEQAKRTKKKPAEKPKAPRRTAQEVVNSLKGAQDITATSIKLERVRRSPVPTQVGKVKQPPWLAANLARIGNDDDDDDDLPSMQTLVQSTTGKQKRLRDQTPIAEEEPPAKLVKVEETDPPLPFERSPTIGRPMLPRCRSQTLVPDIPRRPLSPARFANRVMASPPLSPIKEEPTLKPRATAKQPLFRPPSRNEHMPVQQENRYPTESCQHSDIDELDDSSAV